jgi:glycosyltransferase involved in cell wall biosynthesis
MESGARAVLPRHPDAPIAFLVSTTGCARSIKTNLGSPAYSYYFVLEAFAPVLERYGIWRLVDRPESSLAFLAARLAKEGYRPVHLSLNPPQDGYMTPAVPTIVYPFWEFPRIPDRDFGYDTRQNWARMIRPASLILTACHETAEAFRRSHAGCPVAVVPVPLALEYFDLPPWDPAHSRDFECRHIVLGEASPSSLASGSHCVTDSPQNAVAPLGKKRVWNLARRGFHGIYPWLDPKQVEAIAKVKRVVLSAAKHSPAKLAYLGVRGAYRRTIRRWLSIEALEKITATKNALLAAAGRSPTTVFDPLLPSSRLGLSGLVYTSILNLGDLRKNYMDLLSAFLIAFRDRQDAALVLKLATSPHREHHEVGILRKQYESLGLEHACRVVVITEFLDDAQMRELTRVTTYYVNTSHSEGACLPLQQALAGGRPAIAPRHTAMADYMDEAVGFVPRSHPEPTFWPHDPERRAETERYRLVWSDIHDAFRASADLVDREPDRYQAMGRAARTRMAAYASQDCVAIALREALELLQDHELGRFAWAS